MPTVELVVSAPARHHDLLIGFLMDLGAEAFEERSEMLLAYMPAGRWDEAVARSLCERLGELGLGTPVEERTIEERNWNERWEASIEPIEVGPFFIRPSWKEAPSGYDPRYVLEIDPKMAFGTGYHETTRLLLRFIPELVSEGMRVLDAGTGTGILAMAAVRCGAERVVAFDTDPWAVANAQENTERNKTSDHITVFHGDLQAVHEEAFDLVLANINRNVILKDLPGYVQRLRKGGVVALSGFLLHDCDRVRRAAAEVGLHELQDASENAWWAGVWERRK